MRVTHKLMLVFGVMALALMLMLIKNIDTSIRVKQQHDAFSQALTVSHYALLLVHELQKERGLSSAYLVTPTPENHRALVLQRTETDVANLQFYQHHDGQLQGNDLGFQSFLVAFDPAIRQIYLERDDVDQLRNHFDDAFERYSHAITLVLDWVFSFAASDAVQGNNHALLAYYELLMTKEFAGQERALGAALIFASRHVTLEAYQRFHAVSERQSSAYLLMRQLMRANYRHDLSMLEAHPSTQQLQALRTEIQQKVDRAESLSITQDMWFSLSTERINLLQSFENKVFMDLLTDVQKTAKHNNQVLWANTLLALVLLGIMLYFWFYILHQRFIRPLESISSQLVDIIGSARYQHRIQGELQGEFAIMRDTINEALGKLEEAVTLLEKDKASAERLNEAKSNFVHHITHELRTPLNAILGFTQLLQMEQEIYIKGDPLDQINTAARHLLHIINQVLDMAKVEAGKLDIEHIPYSIHDVVNLVVNMTRETAKQKGLILSAQLSSDLPDQMMGDPTRMRQVLINLIGNAIKFTESGSVTVSVEKQANDHLRVVVTDTGIGMTESAQKKLFQPFTQANESIARQFGGTGLGLSLSKQFVELMGGEIGVSSQLGIGTHFWFVLPLFPVVQNSDGILDHLLIEMQSVEQANKQTELALDNPLQGKIIMLAEDNRVNQLVATKLLAKLGVETIIANNGVEVLNLLANTQVDLLLLDIEMPIKNGYETIAELRVLEQKTGQHLYVIGLSAHGLQEDIERALASGMDDYLAKPIEFELLREKLLLCFSRVEQETLTE